MQNKQLFISGLVGALAIIIGALGAHALKPHLSLLQLESFKTGNNYHIYHSLLLVFLAFVKDNSSKLIKMSTAFFYAGIVLFSGSIYLLSTKDLLGITTWKWLGPITPFGGLCFIAGWVSLAFLGVKRSIN